MKKGKKILAAGLLAAASLSMAGCGDYLSLEDFDNATKSFRDKLVSDLQEKDITVQSLDLLWDFSDVYYTSSGVMGTYLYFPRISLVYDVKKGTETASMVYTISEDDCKIVNGLEPSGYRGQGAGRRYYGDTEKLEEILNHETSNLYNVKIGEKTVYTVETETLEN